MNIVIIGSGRVATHLAQSIDKVENVIQVFSPNLSHAQQLSDRLNSAASINDIAEINRQADLYLIISSDNAIPSIARDLGPIDGIVAHTSGSVPMEELDGVSSNIGVFYLLQTFTKEVPVDMSQVTIFTEANNEHTLHCLDDLARRIAKDALHATSRQRKQLHIAAVFACNFANHLWTIAGELLQSEGYDFQVLEPLLRATLDKALSIGPAPAQTGPASRRDTHILSSHLTHLSGLPHDIYSLLSQSIMSSSSTI